MLGWLGLAALALYAGAVARAMSRPGLAASGYPSPADAEEEIEDLAGAHPGLCRIEEIGRSGEGRALRALRMRAGPEGARPRPLVTAQIHAVEFIGAFVARAVARRLLAGHGEDAEATELLERAELVVVPLLNPDGARRVWRRGGVSGLGQARFTSRGVDPNRNFPSAAPAPGRRAWNSARDRPGSPWYAGPHPLSEPECAALARLADRERFCAAVNFHSFGCVVYLPEAPEPTHPDAERARRALDVFDGPFQSRQLRRYRCVRERGAAIGGQLDPFLLGAFGTPSVTVEVSWPGWHLLKPSHFGNLFWISNPENPERWAGNDAPATVHALLQLLEATGGQPCRAVHPELADALP